MSQLSNITHAIDEGGDYCHPRQSKRTKCVCGNTVTLVRGGGAGTLCKCGRVHRKEPGSSFGSMRESGGIWKRPGGRRGCPGVK
jgi:hypothetical protein